MANREALRELQTRLASRLQAARTEGMSVAWLALRVGGMNLLFPLGQSGEIFPLTSLQPVPYSRAWFPRCTEYPRWPLYGVVDLAAFIAADTGLVQDWQPPLHSDPTVVTLNIALGRQLRVAGRWCSWGCAALRLLPRRSPPAQGAPVYFGTRFVDAAGDAWQEINMRTLSQTHQFLNISA
jgi:twitching motility protein PilI